MANCDVVFLSRCDAFLTRFRHRTARHPATQQRCAGHGTGGSMLDEAILGDGGTAQVFGRHRRPHSKSTRRAESNGAPRRRASVDDERHGGYAREILRIGASAHAQDAHLGNTFAHGFATWPPERWNSAMRNMRRLQNSRTRVWQGNRLMSRTLAAHRCFAALQRAYRRSRQRYPGQRES